MARVSFFSSPISSFKNPTASRHGNMSGFFQPHVCRTWVCFSSFKITFSHPCVRSISSNQNKKNVRVFRSLPVGRFPFVVGRKRHRFNVVTVRRCFPPVLSPDGRVQEDLVVEPQILGWRLQNIPRYDRYKTWMIENCSPRELQTHESGKAGCVLEFSLKRLKVCSDERYDERLHGVVRQCLNGWVELFWSNSVQLEKKN